MANTYATYAGDGLTNAWTVPFAYIAKSHVHVYVNDVEDTTFTWVTDSSVAATVTPPNGSTVLVKRTTPRSSLTVEVPNAGTLRGRDINTQSLQVLYVAEEGYDALNDVLRANTTGTSWDAQSRNIKNLSDPEDATDAVTKQYVDDVIELYADASTSATAAAASASAAATSATNAASSATSAGSSATAASSSATSASSSASAASTSASSASTSATSATSSKNAAATSATNAANSESNAASSASAASTSASNAASSASAAASSATSASSSATSATSSKNAAATSATNAATSETNASNSSTAAASSASAASSSASAASSSASSASTSASTATTQASNAATSASNAATSETNAASSATAAAGSATSAAASYDAFDDRYLGSKAVAPTVDNDGDPLVEGALYWDSVGKSLQVYNGSSWVGYSATSITSWNGRTGAVSPASGDYSASDIDFTPAGTIASTDVQAAIEELDTEKLAASDYTAADVLSKLLTVDGAGSGIDADLLDGNSSAAFALASHTHTASQITDFTEATQDVIGAILADATEFNYTYNDAGNTETLSLIDNTIVPARLAATATSKIFGRKTAGAGAGEELSASDVKTILALSSTDISNFTEATQDVIGALLTDQTEFNYTYDDAGNAESLALIDNTIVAARLKATATNRVFGRKTAGAGAGEELTPSDLLTMIKTVDGAASGLDADTLDGLNSTAFYSSSSPPPGMVLLATLSTASGSTASATGLGTNSQYFILYDGVSMGTAVTLKIALSTNNGGAYGTAISIFSLGTAANNMKGFTQIMGANDANTKHLLTMIAEGNSTVNTAVVGGSTGADAAATAAVNAIQFSLSAGSFDAGTIYIYGVAA